MTSSPASPADRLARSRELMRQAMAARSSPHGGAASPRAPWLKSLLSGPGAGLVVEAARVWWGQHPLRLAGQVAGEAARAVVEPLAQRHPVRLVLGAALLGGVLAWIRPWRWIAGSALLAGLLPQLLTTFLTRHHRRTGRPAPRR